MDYTATPINRMYQLIIFLSVATSITGDTYKDLFQLPDNVLPEKYKLEITTDLRVKKLTFEGRELIQIRCMKNTKQIILHSKGLEITESEVFVQKTLSNFGDTDVKIISQTYDTQNDFYIIKLGEELVPGNIYHLFIPFEGKLNKSKVGYYASSYFDRASNKLKWAALVHMGAIEARRVFPCFDRPDIKASFQISLGHYKRLKAITNMPLLRSEVLFNHPDWVVDYFEESPPMSTYLVSIMVTEFKSLVTLTQDLNTQIRIWAQETSLKHAESVIGFIPIIFSSLEQFFEEKFPLPKLDIIAVPDHNRSRSAAEYWGMITFQAQRLLFDPDLDDIDYTYGNIILLSHKIAEQWFGNRVTMKWWSEYWFSAGMARYLSYKAALCVFPEWTFDDHFANLFLQLLEVDQTEPAHAVFLPIENLTYLEYIKDDSFTYRKVCYLIRMLNMIVSEDVFKRSTLAFLRKYTYGSATQANYWETLTEIAHAAGTLESNMTVQMIMDTWTIQKGYPLLNVNRNYYKSTVTITQQHYVSNIQKQGKFPYDGSCWWVPLTYTNSKELNYNYTKPKAWLSCEGPLTIDLNVTSDHWLLFNLRLSGFYRVKYDKYNWLLLQQTLINEQKYTDIDVFNRQQLIADSMELASNGMLDYEVVFDLITYLKHETEYLPWKCALMGLSSIDQMLSRSLIYEDFNKFMKGLMEPIFNSIGSITEIPSNFMLIKRKLYMLIIEKACYYGIQDCRSQVLNLFNQWIENNSANNNIPGDLLRIITCEAVRAGGKKKWKLLWKRYQKSKYSFLKTHQMLSALGCIENASILRRYLYFMLDTSKIHPDYHNIVFKSVVRNRVGYEEAKNFFTKQFTSILKYLDGNSVIRTLSRYFNFKYKSCKPQENFLANQGQYMMTLAKYTNTPAELKEFQTLSTHVDLHMKEEEIPLEEALTVAYDNVQWYLMHYDNIVQYFSLNED